MNINHPDIQIVQSILTENRSIETAVPLFIGFTEQGDVDTLYEINSLPDYENQLGSAFFDDTQNLMTGAILYYAVKHYFGNGGGKCFILSLGTYNQIGTLSVETLLGKFSDQTLINQLVNEESITLVAIPDLVLLDNWSTEDLNNNTIASFWLNGWKAVLNLTKSREGIFGLLDSPENPKIAKLLLKEFSASFSSEQRGSVAAYWPRLLTDYKFYFDEEPESYDTSVLLPLPPSAAVAAVIQQTDFRRGVWKSPANEILSHVIKPTYFYLEGDELFSENEASINLIRNFHGNGVRIWGCRTLANGSDINIRYIQIRRLLFYIEASLREIARFAIFEPNNDITWLKLKGQVISWLNDLWLNGALFGSSENEAFRVLIGLNESMTVEDIHAGKMIMNISLALLCPAEFIQLNLVLESNESNTKKTYQKNSSIKVGM